MIDVVKDRISDAKEAISKTSEGLDNIDARLSRIETNLSNWNIPKLKHEVEELKHELDNMRNAVSGTADENRVVEYSNKVNDLMNAINQPNADTSQIKGIVLELRDELRGWKNRVISMREKVDSLEEEVNSLSASVSQLDAIEADISTIASVVGSIMDKLISIEQEISSVEKTQNALLNFDNKLSSDLAHPPTRQKVSNFSDNQLETLKQKLKSVGQEKPVQRPVASKQTKPLEVKTRAGKHHVAVSSDGVPIIEEITIGDNSVKKETKKISEGQPGSGSESVQKSKYEGDILELLSHLKETPASKWSLYKDDLLKKLSAALDDARRQISKKKPPNEKTLNLLLSKAELGVISLEAIFDLGDYSKVESVVRNTLRTISDVISQLNRS